MTARKGLLIFTAVFFIVNLSYSTPSRFPASPSHLFPAIACAQTSEFEALKGGTIEEEEPEEISDPLEPLNRFSYHFNDKLYFWVLKPVATVAKGFFPTGLRLAVRNAFYNLEAPARVVNNLLQGKVEQSGTELASFVINSTLGCAGLFEIAQTKFHLKRYREDLGETLGFHGAPPGIYLNWPFFGPSSVRDTVGRIGDGFLNPVNWVTGDYAILVGLKAGDSVNNTSLHIGEYEDFKKAAIDPYISMRSAYHQYRVSKIRQ
jgi:phospholipid-binding lipoprotein MlaA